MNDRCVKNDCFTSKVQQSIYENFKLAHFGYDTISRCASQNEYHKLHRFIREKNQRAGKTYVYEYDSRGNILSKKTYAYTTGELGTTISSKDYYYGDTWSDQLVRCESDYYSYDALGNPTMFERTVNGTYAMFNLTWEKVRQLASVTYGTNTVNYEYGVYLFKNTNFTMPFKFPINTNPILT